MICILYTSITIIQTWIFALGNMISVHNVIVTLIKKKIKRFVESTKRNTIYPLLPSYNFYYIHFFQPHCNHQYTCELFVGIVKRYGFQTVHDFYKTFVASKTANADYRDKADKWKKGYGEKSQKQEESVHRRLQNCQRENVDKQTKHTSKSKDKGAR